MTGEVYESVRAVLHEAAREVMGGKRVRVVPLDLVISPEDPRDALEHVEEALYAVTHGRSLAGYVSVVGARAIVVIKRADDRP